jgi:alkylation response protein AidB-like acyl-CoA dehydrogenase
VQLPSETLSGACVIDLSLSPDQAALRDLAHTFAERELRPIAAEADETGEFPPALVTRAAELGLTAYAIPSEYGGGGLDAVTSAIVAEELAWGDVGIAAALGGAGLCAGPIVIAGTEEQKQRHLTRLARPGTLGAVAFSEPGAGSDLAAMRTRARREGDHYVLHGEKAYITNGGVADLYVIFATLDPGQGAAGVTAFIVDAGSPGLLPGARSRPMGLRASHTGSIHLDGVRVPEEDVLGGAGGGFPLALAFFERSRPQVAASAVGVARAAYEHAAGYAREREAFGRPLAALQAVAFMLADMGALVEASRLLVWRACALLDAGLEAGLAGAWAKAFAADAAMRVTTEAVEVLGGAGLMRDHPVERWMRDAKVLQIVEGTSEIQREIAGRHVAAGVLAPPGSPSSPAPGS